MSVLSSADEHDEPEAPKAQPMSKAKVPSASSKASHGEHVQYWDNAKNAFVRLVGDSEVEATLALGPKGFLTARFPDEEPIDIEVQNCMLGLEFKKRKQVCKKPASNTKTKKSKTTKQVRKKTADEDVDREEVEFEDADEPAEEQAEEEKEEEELKEEPELIFHEEPVLDKEKEKLQKKPVAAAPEPILTYDEARGNYIAKHSAKMWEHSDEREQAIARMLFPEVKRRRFERLRLDLFVLDTESKKWVLK